jgi:hypothetical protein
MAPESQGYKVLGTTCETWWRSLPRHRPELRALDWDDDPRGEVRDDLAMQPCAMGLDRSGTSLIDDHGLHDRCHHCRLDHVDDQAHQGEISNHAGDECLPHQGSQRQMHRPDDRCTQLDACRDHKCPRFPLQHRRLNLGGILTEGYQVTTTIRGVRFRFTAVLC